MIKEICLIIFFYLLTLFQNSFLIHYLYNGNIVNIVLAFVIIFAFFQKEESHIGLIAALSGGLFLDIFSPYFFGLFTLTSLSFFLLIKFLKSFFASNKFISFSIISFVVFLLYEVLLSLLSLSSGLHFNFFNFLFNFLLSLIIYLLFRLGYVFVQKSFSK